MRAIRLESNVKRLAYDYIISRRLPVMLNLRPTLKEGEEFIEGVKS